jgi:hypothetical protein
VLSQPPVCLKKALAVKNFFETNATLPVFDGAISGNKRATFKNNPNFAPQKTVFIYGARTARGCFPI